MACNRCGSKAPGERPTAEDIALSNPLLLEGAAPCACCIGLSMGGIADMVYALQSVPTDALLRELARRFL